MTELLNSAGCNNDQQHISKSFPEMVVMVLPLGQWPQEDLLANVKVLVSFFKVTRFDHWFGMFWWWQGDTHHALNCACSDSTSVSQALPPDPHINPPWELLQHQRGIGWRVKHTDSDRPPQPEGLGLNPESLLASVWPQEAIWTLHLHFLFINEVTECISMRMKNMS